MSPVHNVTFKVRNRHVESGEVEWTYPTTDDYFKENFFSWLSFDERFERFIFNGHTNQ